MSDSLPIFVHVLAATLLFGAVLTALLLSRSGAAGKNPELFAAATFRTLLFVALPTWLLLIIFGTWAEHAGDVPETERWLKIGSAIGNGTILVLLAAIGAAYAWTKTPRGPWQSRAVMFLTLAYIVALAAAWWVMSAKPGAS